MKAVGIHLLCELSHCGQHTLDDPAWVRRALEKAARSAKATVLDGYFHKFTPTGVSGLLCLKESHISVHTWPEYNYAAADIYTCGTTTVPHKAIEVLVNAFKAGQTQVREITRGMECGDRSFENRDTTFGPKNALATGTGNDPNDTRDFVTDADPHEQHRLRVAERLASQNSAFQQIRIFRNECYGKMLFLDGSIQSSERDEYIYHEALVHPALLAHPNPRRVLVLGGGEGAALREILRHKTIREAVMVDIDRETVRLCQEHLPEWSAGAYEDPRTRLVVADGKRWMEENEETFDVIYMDLTDQIDQGASLPLYTQSFYRTVKKRLNPGGLLVVQAGELSACEYFSHCTIRRTLNTVFPQVISYLQHVPSFFSQWSFVVASAEDTNVDPSGGRINERIAERVRGELKFYDNGSHARMFMLPKDIRARLNQEGFVVTTPKAFAKAFEQRLAQLRESAGPSRTTGLSRQEKALAQAVGR